MSNMSKRVISIIIASLLLFCGIIIPTIVRDKSYAAEEDVEHFLLSSAFADSLENLIDQNISQGEIDNFTPFDDSYYGRMGGNSLRPELVGEEGYKVIDKTINISSQVEDINLAGKDTTHYVLSMWVFFDVSLYNITRNLEITLFDDNNNSIKFSMAPELLQDILKREELERYDAKIFTSVNSAKIGWSKIYLPFTSGIVNGNIVNANQFNFTKLKIAQESVNSVDLPLSFYNIALLERDDITTPTAEVQDYANIVTKQVAIVDDKTVYYKGERFSNVLTKHQLIAACYVGRENYLNASNESNLVVEADPGLGFANIITFSYGSNGFIMDKSSYTIRYCIKYNGKNIAVATDMLVVSSYGKGIWIEPISGDLEIGKEYKLYYDIHDAFKGDGVSFSSSDEDVLKIIEVNKMERFLKVKAEKKGNATIKAMLQDDRLVDTSYENGIVNEEFKVSVVKASSKINTTVVLLWSALGLIIVALIYMAVRAIISARKVEVK